MVSSVLPTRRTISSSSTTSTTTASQPSKPATGATRTPTSWDPADDKLLRHLKEVQKLGWKEIASNFSNRTPNACQFRWRRLKSGSLKSLGYAQGPVQEPINAKDLGNSSRTPTPMSGGGTSGSSTTTTPPPPHEVKQRRYSSSVKDQSAAVLSSDSGSSPESSVMMSGEASPKTNTPSPPAPSIGISGRPNWSHFKGGTAMLKRDSSATAAIEEESDSSFDDGDSADENIDSSRGNNSTAVHSSVGTSGNSTGHLHWSPEEDELLAKIRHHRSLSFTELSILLPTKTEIEIRSRIDQLTLIRSRSNSTQTTSLPRPCANSSVMIEPHLLSKSANSSISNVSRSKRNSMSKLINPYPLPNKSNRSQSISNSSTLRPKFYSVSGMYGSSSSPNTSFLNQDFLRSRSLSFSISSASLTSSNTNQNSICSNERGFYRKDSISHPAFNSTEESDPRASLFNMGRKSSLFGIESTTMQEDDNESVIEDD